jgi:hypothetical protein
LYCSSSFYTKLHYGLYLIVYVIQDTNR